MRDVHWYFDRARARAGIPSDNQLAARLGITGPSVVQLRKGQHLPADATMLKLAELAEVPVETALLDLNMWRTKGDAARSVYSRIAAMIAQTVTALLLCIGAAGPATSAENGTGTNQPQDESRYTLCDKL